MIADSIFNFGLYRPLHRFKQNHLQRFEFEKVQLAVNFNGDCDKRIASRYSKGIRKQFLGSVSGAEPN